MLPVVADQRTFSEPEMTGNDDIIGDDADVVGIKTRADQLTGQFAGDRVTVTVRADQAG